MKTYRCVYENDVEADSPEEAAIECYRLMQDDVESILHSGSSNATGSIQCSVSTVSSTT